MKKQPLLLTAVLSLGLLASLSGCKSGGGDSVTVWTFSNELKEIVKNYYNNKGVKVQIKSSVTQVKDDLANAQKSGKSIPTINRHISILIREGLIEHRGSKKTGGYYIK